MSKHTPGPWQIWGNHIFVQGERGANICSLSDPRGSDIVGYHKPNMRSKDAAERNANARLIAAAPDMLEALRAVLDLHVAHHNHPTHAAARAAIAKAEGRP